VTELVLPGRSQEPERMDVEPVPPEELARALADLEWLASLGLYHRPVFQWLSRIARGRRSLSLLDVACGGGDMLRRIARWGARKGLNLRLEGVDLNPQARVVAERATDPDLGITYRTADALAIGGALEPDVIISSHFAHHLSDGDLVRFLRWSQATARVGWFVNDLQRSRVLEASLKVIGRVVRLHRFVVSDGPISVRRSLVRADWEAALRAAGIPRESVEVRWYAPFRWGVGTRPA
jgi:2-polyprenyl-3-methyl-5-hydroxy-6-metoxy-1,4-benzoquinol methylase